MRSWRFVCTRGHGHSLTFDPGLSWCDNFKHLIKKPLNQFNGEPVRAGGHFLNGPGHMIILVVHASR